MTQTYVDLEAESTEQLATQAFEHAYDQGWTDGLPIIPPSAKSVGEFVAAANRGADELIAIVPPRNGRVTIEVIAINAIMAGCRPEYMPVVIAAIEGLTDKSFPLEELQVTTTSSPAPFLLINGRVRQKLYINYLAGCLGPGWRANATISRAVHLILCNGGGTLSGVYSKSCFASPLRSNYNGGENEEASPWTPFHADRGFAPELSTVTVFYALNFCSIPGNESDGANEILRQLATNMPPLEGSDSALVLLSVNHARALHDAGLGKRDVQQRLWELARLPVDYFTERFVKAERAAGRGDAKTVWRAASPDQFYVVVAGAGGLVLDGLKPQDVYIAVKSPQTRVIRGNYPPAMIPPPAF